MTGPRVFFWVQHLLGIGHTVRAARIARAMRDSGLVVTYVFGGFEAPGEDLAGIELVRLPPVRSLDATFRTLVGADGGPVDARWWATRREALLTAFRAATPDVVMIESFPFGRGAFRAELLPLLEKAAGHCRIVCSLRDILVEKRDPARRAAMVDLVRRYFDLVLVHGDPRLVPLKASFPEAGAIADKMRYTGYVAPEPPHRMPSSGPGDAVIVSAGGGAAGGALMRTALAARPLTRLASGRWRFLAGPNLPAADRAGLRPAPGVTIEPARADFLALLARAGVSVSQAGYNTVADLLVTGTPAVLVPFGAHGQTEQPLRARLLAGRGRAVALDEADLTPERLAQAIDRADGTTAGALDIDLGGATRTAALVADLAAAVQAA